MMMTIMYKAVGDAKVDVGAGKTPKKCNPLKSVMILFIPVNHTFLSSKNLTSMIIIIMALSIHSINKYQMFLLIEN